MEFLGLFLGILIGLTIGVMGSGGSIVTIPILVYIMNYTVAESTVYAMFIVGFTALVGSIKVYSAKVLPIIQALLFAVPSVFSMIMVRTFLVPNLPEEVFFTSSLSLPISTLLLLFFAIVLFWSALAMLKIPPADTQHNLAPKSYTWLVANSIWVGGLSGLLGVGGGFLVIPVLHKRAGLSMQQAVAASMLIITLNSFIGFGISYQQVPIHWPFLLVFNSLAIMGVLFGIFIHNKISITTLKTAFAWFILCIGAYIIFKEFFHFSI
jgi:uncharacterized protein